MKKRLVIMLVLVGLFIAGIGAVKAAQIHGAIAASAKFAPPPTVVTTTVVKQERWQPTLAAVGSLRAVNGVVVSTDLPGIVSEIAFQSGQEVTKGDLLIRLDSQQEDAQLRSAEARLDLATSNLERYRDLVKQGAVSQSDYDGADSSNRQAVASVDEARALIARKTIVAPFDGLLGIRQADLGQYLNAGEPIVALQSVDPILVEFAFPQQELEHITVGKQLRLQAAGLAEEQFDGTIAAIDSRVDEHTRNILIQGTINNPERKLRPGMFVNVEVLLPETATLSIPASSINYAPYGDSVFVVKDNKVQEQFVKLGQNRGDQVAVVSGVREGDEVVSSGVFKLRSGIPVQVDNSVQPGNDVSPTPPNS